MTQSQPLTVQARVATSCEAPAPFGYDDLLDRCMGNLELAQRVLRKYRCKFGSDHEELMACGVKNDASEVARVAHRMKGAAASIGAPVLREKLAVIEQAGRDEELGGVVAAVEGVRHEWTRFVTFTDRFLPDD